MQANRQDGNTIFPARALQSNGCRVSWMNQELEALIRACDAVREAGDTADISAVRERIFGNAEEIGGQ